MEEDSGIPQHRQGTRVGERRRRVTRRRVEVWEFEVPPAGRKAAYGDHHTGGVTGMAVLLILLFALMFARPLIAFFGRPVSNSDDPVERAEERFRRNLGGPERRSGGGSRINAGTKQPLVPERGLPSPASNDFYGSSGLR